MGRPGRPAGLLLRRAGGPVPGLAGGALPAGAFGVLPVATGSRDAMRPASQTLYRSLIILFSVVLRGVID